VTPQYRVPGEDLGEAVCGCGIGLDVVFDAEVGQRAIEFAWCADA
jgi:hypothetical protein